MLTTESDYFEWYNDTRPLGFEALFSMSTTAFYSRVHTEHESWVYLFEAYAPWTDAAYEAWVTHALRKE